MTEIPPSPPSPVCVYIAGSGRNGSTLLGMHLDRYKDLFFAGELTHIWGRGFLNDELCGCGVPFSRCNFWTEVAKLAFGAFSKKDARHVQELRNRVSAFTGLPCLMVGMRHAAPDALIDYATCYLQLIRAISSVAGSRIIVDSSKYPTDMAALLFDSRVNMRVVHLVRNCHAVVFSWKRKKQRVEIHWRDQSMPRYGTLQTAIGWKIFNRTIARVAASQQVDYRLLRYEDVVEDLEGTLDKLLLWLDCAREHRQQRDGETNHTASGNPCRFHFNPDEVHLDNEWSTGLSPVDQWIVNLLCGRDQRLYGY